MDMDNYRSDVFNDTSCSSVTLANLDSSTTVVVNEEVMTLRVKFLCSFGGSILPRPQDGKLRYVGGETRILSVPRNVGYEDLMGRMRELYDGAAILKYQQPDEDLDALVSVVNDDDVTNMMEEYDKLGSADGFTRIRIFLFSHIEQDVSPHYMDDERDTERRYVDALNSLNESLDYRRDRMNDSPVMTPVDEVQITDQLYNSMNLEGSVHNQRNYEMALPQYNLRQLAVPSLGSGQYSGSVAQRYSEDAPWSPAYYSPRCGGAPEGRAVGEFPSSPSSARFRMPSQEVPDRYPEESGHLHISNQVPYDQQQQYSDNVIWMQPGGLPVDRGGFPGNILNGPSAVDGASVCGHCKMTFQRNPSSSDFHWKPEEQSQMEQPFVGNGFSQVTNPCLECHRRREAGMLSTDLRLQHGVYNRDQVDSHALYNDNQTTDRGWVVQNQTRMDEPRQRISGVGRMGEHYTLNGTGTSTPVGLGNLPDVNLVPTTYGRNEDPRYIRSGAELGGEIYQGQTFTTGSHVHNPIEERGMRSSNSPFSYGADIPQQVLHSNPSAQSLWRNAPSSVHIPPVHDSFNPQPRNGIPSPVVPRSTTEGSPGFFVGVDQSPRVDSSQWRLGADGYPYGQITKLNPGIPPQETQLTLPQDPFSNPPSTLNIQPVSMSVSHRASESPLSLLSDNLLPSGGRGYTPVQRDNTGNIEVGFDERSVHCEVSDKTNLYDAERSNLYQVHPSKQETNPNMTPTIAAPNGMHPGDQVTGRIQPGEPNTSPLAENEDLSFLPELIASAKRAKLRSVEVVKARAQDDSNAANVQEKQPKLATADETEPQDFENNSDDGSENENLDVSKIETTKAEEEATAKGLQFIKNADLEEIRELGTGTYGAVYHGKWKGSDVAIKRIKASCFAGRPSERERLIADFWKEALILSSLHHPNVVSFYGIVRDGPDGSLATVTEFMVNGSLKQYLQKKDRTIDRRKRLIIAMDAAFGMEYLHGKNIVHFDLKCENLLVNMRDPHRPVCKIGDLGLSKVKQQTLVSGGVRGTLPWMAPELLSGKSNMVTEKIDVYSFGIVMWELLTGEEPYKDRHCASIIGGIVNNILRPQIPTWCDPEWKSLMQSCWAADPAERPSFPEISQKLRSMAAAMNIK